MCLFSILLDLATLAVMTHILSPADISDLYKFFRLILLSIFSIVRRSGRVETAARCCRRNSTQKIYPPPHRHFRGLSPRCILSFAPHRFAPTSPCEPLVVRRIPTLFVATISAHCKSSAYAATSNTLSSSHSSGRSNHAALVTVRQHLWEELRITPLGSESENFASLAQTSLSSFSHFLRLLPLTLIGDSRSIHSLCHLAAFPRSTSVCRPRPRRKIAMEEETALGRSLTPLDLVYPRSRNPFELTVGSNRS